MQLAGVLYTEEREKAQQRYQEAIRRAKFLSKEERKHWALLGYILTNEQLEQAEHLIIDEDLRRLHTKHQLEKIKPIKDSKHG